MDTALQDLHMHEAGLSEQDLISMLVESIIDKFVKPNFHRPRTKY